MFYKIFLRQISKYSLRAHVILIRLCCCNFQSCFIHEWIWNPTLLRSVVLSSSRFGSLVHWIPQIKTPLVYIFRNTIFFWYLPFDISLLPFNLMTSIVGKVNHALFNADEQKQKSLFWFLKIYIFFFACEKTCLLLF